MAEKGSEEETYWARHGTKALPVGVKAKYMTMPMSVILAQSRGPLEKNWGGGGKRSATTDSHWRRCWEEMRQMDSEWGDMLGITTWPAMRHRLSERRARIRMRARGTLPDAAWSVLSSVWAVWQKTCMPSACAVRELCCAPVAGKNLTFCTLLPARWSAMKTLYHAKSLEAKKTGGSGEDETWELWEVMHAALGSTPLSTGVGQQDDMAGISAQLLPSGSSAATPAADRTRSGLTISAGNVLPQARFLVYIFFIHLLSRQLAASVLTGPCYVCKHPTLRPLVNFVSILNTSRTRQPPSVCSLAGPRMQAS